MNSSLVQFLYIKVFIKVYKKKVVRLEKIKHAIDDLSRFVLILLRMRMQEFLPSNKNINKGADQ